MLSHHNTKRLTITSVMLALSTAIAFICGFIPFLSLPFGGGFTLGSMLPIIVISYMYGVKWGFTASGIYALIQIALDLLMGKGSVILPLFMPSDEGYMGLTAAIAILVLDYLCAYTVLGIGGIFRRTVKKKALALTLGVLLALSLRYLFHILSGYVFYGAWAEWFFSQEGFYAIGEWILGAFSGRTLALIYSAFYNGTYMLPEIVITAVIAPAVARIPRIRAEG